MDKLIASLLERPLRALALGLAVPIVALTVCASLLFDPFRANGSGPHLNGPTALELAGQQVYTAQGCQYCHTQAVRSLSTELLRYAPAESYGYFPAMTAAESEFDAPSVRGSRRIGPDLARIGGKWEIGTLRRMLEGKDGSGLSQGLHRYGNLFGAEAEYSPADALFVSWRVRALLQAGVPLSDPLHQSVFSELEGRTRGDALIAYLMRLGAHQRAFAGAYFKK